MPLRSCRRPLDGRAWGPCMWTSQACTAGSLRLQLPSAAGATDGLPAVLSMDRQPPPPHPPQSIRGLTSPESDTEPQLLCPDRLTWLLQVNMLMSNKGTVLRADVNGRIVMKVFLSGMPDVKLGLNDKLEVRMRIMCGGCAHSGVNPCLQHCVTMTTNLPP